LILKTDTRQIIASIRYLNKIPNHQNFSSRPKTCKCNTNSSICIQCQSIFFEVSNFVFRL